MTPLHVLYISAFSQWGGSTISLLRRIKKLDHEIFRVTVVVPEDGPMVERYRAAGARVIIVPFVVLFRFSSFLQILTYLFNFVPSVFRLYFLIKKLKVDIVHSNDSIVLVGGMAGCLAGANCVTHMRDDLKEPKWVIRLRNLVINWFSDRVLAVSEAVLDNFVAFGGDRSKSRVLYNGVDINVFRPQPTDNGRRKELSIPEGAKVVTHIGRIDPNKGQHIVAYAAADVIKSIPYAHFLLVGDVNATKFNSYRKQLMRILKEKGLLERVVLAGRQDNIHEIINLSDVIVLPSAYEAHPAAICEASSCGKPVVASRVGGLSEMVKDGETGYLIPPQDVEALADSLIRILSDEVSATNMGMAGRRYMLERFDIDKSTYELAWIYEDLAGNGEMR